MIKGDHADKELDRFSGLFEADDRSTTNMVEAVKILLELNESEEGDVIKELLRNVTDRFNLIEPALAVIDKVEAALASLKGQIEEPLRGKIGEYGWNFAEECDEYEIDELEAEELARAAIVSNNFHVCENAVEKLKQYPELQAKIVDEAIHRVENGKYEWADSKSLLYLIEHIKDPKVQIKIIEYYEQNAKGGRIDYYRIFYIYERYIDDFEVKSHIIDIMEAHRRVFRLVQILEIEDDPELQERLVSLIEKYKSGAGKGYYWKILRRIKSPDLQKRFFEILLERAYPYEIGYSIDVLGDEKLALKAMKEFLKACSDSKYRLFTLDSIEEGELRDEYRENCLKEKRLISDLEDEQKHEKALRKIKKIKDPKRRAYLAYCTLQQLVSNNLESSIADSLVDIVSDDSDTCWRAMKFVNDPKHRMQLVESRRFSYVYAPLWIFNHIPEPDLCRVGVVEWVDAIKGLSRYNDDNYWKCYILEYLRDYQSRKQIVEAIVSAAELDLKMVDIALDYVYEEDLREKLLEVRKSLEEN